jgi:hypothetical protein
LYQVGLEAMGTPDPAHIGFTDACRPGHGTCGPVRSVGGLWCSVIYATFPPVAW